MSSHRFLLEGATKPGDAPSGKDDIEQTDEPANEPKIKNSDKEEPIKKREFSRFMTKGQYALLSDEDKAAYLDKFPGSTHKIKPPRVKARPSSVIHNLDDMTDDEVESYHQELMAELDGVGTENKASINRESIGAINDVTTDDMKEAGEDIRVHADDIADDVAKRFANRPRLLQRGLSGLRKMWGASDVPPVPPAPTGDPEEDERREEISIKEKRHTQEALTQIAKYVLIGAGIVALGVAASPLALVIAHVMLDAYGREILDKKDRSKDYALEDEKRKNEKIKKENKTMKAAEKDRLAQIKAKKKAIEQERKRQEKEKKEKEEELAKRAEDDQTTSDDKEDAPEDEEVDDTVGDNEDDIEDEEDEAEPLKVAASAQDEIEYSHEDDQNTLVEVIRQIGEYLESNTADDLRNNARIAFGDKASHLVSESSATYQSIEDLAKALNGTVDNNFVVTASARYEYSELTGRYNNATD